MISGFVDMIVGMKSSLNWVELDPIRFFAYLETP